MHNGFTKCYILAILDACMGRAMAVPRRQRPTASLRLDLLLDKGGIHSCTGVLLYTLFISETCTAACTNGMVRTKQLSHGTLHEGSWRKRLGIRSIGLG
jgi:hypothetical protein